MAKLRTISEQHQIERDYYLGNSKNVPNTSKSQKELSEDFQEAQNKQDAHFEKRRKEYLDRKAKEGKIENVSTLVTAAGVVATNKPDLEAEAEDTTKTTTNVVTEPLNVADAPPVEEQTTDKAVTKPAPKKKDT